MPPRALLPAESAVLGLLWLAPMHGYEMAHYFEGGDLSEVCPIEQSLLYTYLRNVQSRGLVEWTEERVGLRPPRKLFSLTSEGLGLIERWLDEPVGRMREVRQALLVKLYVLGRKDPGRACRLLERQLAVCEAYRSRLVQQEARASGFERLVAGSKRSAAEATVAWISDYLNATPADSQGGVR